MNLLDIFATLSLDSSNYEEGLGNAESSASSFGSKITKGLGTAAKVGGTALATLGTAAVGTSVAFVKGIADVGEYADHVDKMSQKLHMSAESYQEWDFIMQHTGASIDSMGMSMKTLTNAMDSGSDAFTELGLSIEEMQSMSQEDAFAATITALQGVEDETQRTVLAQELLGRGATELAPLLNQTAAETEAMKQQAHDLGGVMSDEAVKAGARFKDSLTNLKTSLGGLKNTMLSQFLPASSKLFDGLAKVFSGDNSGIAMIEEGLGEFANNLLSLVPQMAEVATSIMTTLIEVIIQNLPMLMDSAVQIIITLVDKLTAPDMLDTVVDAIKQVMTSLINGIIIILPKLIPAVIEIIMTIVNTLIEPENLKLLITAAVDIVIAIATGIADNLDELIPAVVEAILTITTELLSPENLTKLIIAGIDIIKGVAGGIVQALGLDKWVSALGDVWSAVSDFFGGLIEAAFDWGKDMISNFADGIIDAADLCTDGIDEIATGVKNLLGHSTPKEGPLKNDDEWGSDFMQNFIDGINDKKRELEMTVSGTANLIAGDFSEVNALQPSFGMAGTGAGQIVIPVYIGNEKIDELVVNSNQRYDYISGGRG